jgi:hypothetical protein
MAMANRSSSSIVRTRGGSRSEGCVPDVARLEPDNAVSVWRLARTLVTKKWGILKFCSDFLDDSVGWETNERERIFTRRREAWKIRNMRFLNLKEGKKNSENQPQKDSVWQFWKRKSEDDNSKNSSIKTSEKIIIEREALIKKLEEDKKKARTAKKKTKLREDCVHIMRRLIEDWDLQKPQEEDEAYRKLADSEVQQWTVSVKQVADERDNQGQVVMDSSRVAELATKFEMKKLEDEPAKTETKLTRPRKVAVLKQKMTVQMKLTQPKMTTPASIDQTEPDGSTAMTKIGILTTDKIHQVQPLNLPSAMTLGKQNKTFSTKPIQVLCSQSEVSCTSEPVCGPVRL